MIYERYHTQGLQCSPHPSPPSSRSLYTYVDSTHASSCRYSAPVHRRGTHAAMRAGCAIGTAQHPTNPFRSGCTFEQHLPTAFNYTQFLIKLDRMVMNCGPHLPGY